MQGYLKVRDIEGPGKIEEEGCSGGGCYDPTSTFLILLCHLSGIIHVVDVASH